MYSVIRRLEKVNDDEYLFVFSQPVKDSIYTIYYEAKISADSANTLLAGMQKDTPESLLDSGDKVNISVEHKRFCQVTFTFDGFLLPTPFIAQFNGYVLTSVDVVKKASGIYSIRLKKCNYSDNNLLEYIISEAVYSTIQKLVGISEEKFLQDIFLYFEAPKECEDLKFSLHYNMPLLEDISLKEILTE